MNEYLVKYSVNENKELRFAKLNSNSYSEACDKAIDIVISINEKNKDFNLEFKLIEIININSIELW